MVAGAVSDVGSRKVLRAKVCARFALACSAHRVQPPRLLIIIEHPVSARVIVLHGCIGALDTAVANVALTALPY